MFSKMNKPYTNKKRRSAVNFLLLSVMLIGVFSCNKPFDNTLESTGPEVSPNPVNRKTLLIVVDGAVGAEVEAIKPPTLNSLVDYSIFSWDGLTDFKNNNITNAYAWTTLLTGTNSDKHNVTGNDFTGNNLAAYPSIFTRLKQERAQLRTAAFCSSPEVADNLAADATEKKSLAEDDAAVKQAVITELSSKDPSLVLAQFHDVDKAGAAGSYSASSPDYKNAILKVDSYIGEILTAMRNRSSFKDENWMVIITSNKGNNTPYVPVATPWNAFQDGRHNTFFFCYNPRFTSSNPTKPNVIPYIGTSPFYTGTQSQNRRAKVLSGGTTYDIGSSGSYTIQCKVNFPVGGVNYPAFLSKRASFAGGVVGWVFFREGDYWQINFGQTGLGNRQIRGHSIADGQWHTLTAIIRQEGTARNVYTYTDGVLYPFTGNRNIATYGNLNSPQPLTVGNLPPDNNTGLKNYFVTDIRIYNTDLSDTYIANNYCKVDVEPSDPYKNNLLGFWPSNSVAPDKTIPDLSPNNHPLVIEGYAAGSFNDVTGNVCPLVTDVIYKTVPNSVDIAFQIYQWLGVTAPPSWLLDGKSWIPAYSDVSG
jgi:hypothetical protein